MKPNSIKAEVIADSTSPAGKRITTLQLRYPRIIHAELMTHRVFSRNASSSRAIPISKMLSQVWNDPASPVAWGTNKPGMQAGSEVQGWRRTAAMALWNLAGKVACVFAWILMKIGLHKQIANRLLEPWQFIQVVLSATEFDNWFELRDHHMADPTIHELAKIMREAMDRSVPRQLTPGQWHMPYVRYLINKETGEQRFFEFNEDMQCMWMSLNHALQASTARCARVSYTLQDGAPTDFLKDQELYLRLVGSKPIHASPTEHQATPDDERWVLPRGGALQEEASIWANPELHGNFQG